MSANRDVSRIVRAWIRAEKHDSADRVLQIVLSRLDTTPQGRSWWPARRFAHMSNYARLAIGAAAAVIVMVLATSLLSRAPVGGPGATGNSPTATPIPTTLPSSGPSASAGALAFPAPGPLAIGRHGMTRSGIRMSVEVTTTGWGSHTNGFKLTKNLDDAAIIFWTAAPDGVYEDSCTQAKGPPSDDPATLAGAVARIPDTELVSGPTDVTVGGQPAQEVEIRIMSEPACPTALYLWFDEFGGRWASFNGDTMIEWIIDVGGTLVWIDAEMRKDADPALEQEIRAMVDSIKFE